MKVTSRKEKEKEKKRRRHESNFAKYFVLILEWLRLYERQRYVQLHIAE